MTNKYLIQKTRLREDFSCKLLEEISIGIITFWIFHRIMIISIFYTTVLYHCRYQYGLYFHVILLFSISFLALLDSSLLKSIEYQQDEIVELFSSSFWMFFVANSNTRNCYSSSFTHSVTFLLTFRNCNGWSAMFSSSSCWFCKIHESLSWSVMSMTLSADVDIIYKLLEVRQPHSHILYPSSICWM